MGGVTTFHLGGYAEYFIQDNISVQGGLSFSGNGGKQEDSGSYMGSSYSGKDKTSLMYLTVPVNLMYHLDKMYFGAGPYIGFALSGKIKSTSTIDGDTETEEDSIEFGNDSSADMKSADFGLNLQAGYKIQDNINVGLGYSLGLSNLSPSGTGSIKNRAFSISVGYSF